MLTGALIIYLFADIRDMARAGELSLTLDDLQPPLTSQEILTRIKGSQEALEKKAINCEDLQNRLDAIKNIKAHNTSTFGRMFGTKDHNVIMTNFMDDRSSDEMVHSVVVNEIKKRVTVIFRGSVTQKDFIQDAKCAQHKMDNPVARLVDNKQHTTENIRVHTGFHEYLFQENEEGVTRIDQVLGEAKQQLEKHPGYRLYITGHSLGGALSTLFGFFAAANDDMIALSNGPIVIYSVASPYCGNWKFRMAFQELERQKRVQHLRIANAEDMVTLLPFASAKLSAFSPLATMMKGAGNLYKHVGIRLQMSQDGDHDPFSLFYPKDQSNEDDYNKEITEALKSGKSLAKAFYYCARKDFDTVVKFHSCEEYEERLEENKTSMVGVTLDDLYADKSVVGNMMDKDYAPAHVSGTSFQRAARAFGVWKSSTSSSSSSSLIKAME